MMTKKELIQFYQLGKVKIVCLVQTAQILGQFSMISSATGSSRFPEPAAGAGEGGQFHHGNSITAYLVPSSQSILTLVVSLFRHFYPSPSEQWP